MVGWDLLTIRMGEVMVAATEAVMEDMDPVCMGAVHLDTVVGCTAVELYGSGMYGGGYGGMNRYGMNEPVQNSFAQRAETDARQAFQSIESVVHVFGSISMMLESTFNAVYSSFRAVIGVADHFSRLKLHLTEIFSAIAMIKTLKWIFRKILAILRLRSAADLDEKWEGAASAAISKELGELDGKPSRWPVLIFFAMVFGGPWLIWKLLSSFMKERMDEDWSNGNGDHFVAVALYDFSADSEEEVSFRKGQQIRIAPKELQPRVRGWLLGSVDGQHKGLLPAEYVTVKGKQRGKKHLINSPGEVATAKNTDTAMIGQDTEWDSANQKATNAEVIENNFSKAFGASDQAKATAP